MIPQEDRTSIVVGIVVCAALLFGVAGTLPAFSQPAENPSPSGSEAALALQESITYQGRLTDSGGNPLSGEYNMQFFLYDAVTGGNSLFDSGQMNVNVSDGLFTVSLPIPQSTFDGQALWLAIVVEGQTLSPRQEVAPTAYAMGLRPGANIEQDTAGNGLSVQNLATGTAIRAESTHIGLYGQSANFAVYGFNDGGPGGSGYGGYFTSTTGTGVFGSTTAVPTTTNPLPSGVHGYSENGAGLLGEAGSQFAWAGFFDGNVRVDGSLVISDSLFAEDKNGYLMDIALNDSTEPLAQGDVVEVTGATDPMVGGIPVPLVQKVGSAESTGVIGVVDRMYQDGQMQTGPTPPGEYLSVVTMGAFSGVKVDAAYGAVQPGDLLVSSPTPGYAMRADSPEVGTVIGKAMSPLQDGSGTVAVLVTMQ